MDRVVVKSTFKLLLQIPLLISHPEKEGLKMSREEFFDWIWGRFASQGLVGVHEGTLLSEEAAQQGLETDSWTVDSAEAPRERDWVGHQEQAQVELYFDSKEQASTAAQFLGAIPDLILGSIEEQKPEDWDAQWKASFLNSGEGVEIPPFWKIVPPWVEDQGPTETKRWIRINPGAGFGTGTHETTQLCLQAIGEFSQKNPLRGSRYLDFGSGSGILSIGLALLGAQVDSVEIDELAIENARENAELNQVKDLILFMKNLPLASELPEYSGVIANILRPVLIEYSKDLVARLKPQGVLILSGLIERDLSSVIEVYSRLLKSSPIQILSENEWRALVFQKET